MSSHNYSVIKLSLCPSRYDAKQLLSIQSFTETNSPLAEPDASCFPVFPPPLIQNKMPPPPHTGPQWSQ